MWGQNGNDLLFGGAGADDLYGLAHNDQLSGGDGSDELMGGDGNDRMNGDAGADSLWGENGDDVLIAIDDDAFSDWVRGDAGKDVIWVDRTWILWASFDDAVASPEAADKVQYVTSFANGADRTLDGDDIADPAVKAFSGHVYRRFAGNPLFAASGPSMNDVRQGALGDCYALAGLAAIAKDSPHALRQNVVDFGDGTYGVKLGDSFYRVDSDLPVADFYSATPVYAALGAENSMWTAVVEKAWAHHRTGASSYGSIEAGVSVEINRAFGSTTSGAKQLSQYTTARSLADDIYARFSRGEAVTIGILSEKVTGVGGAPLIMGHQYTIAAVNRNASGVVTSITLRNPWGRDGAGNDANPNDGLVTVTPAQLFRYHGVLNWGRVG
jgi:Ca2+-binding RTX toxin-like protein